MNENNYIQTIGENSTLQDSIIENMYLKAFASISDAENTSKEKYITKTMLIKSSNDMSTQEHHWIRITNVVIMNAGKIYYILPSYHLAY